MASSNKDDGNGPADMCNLLEGAVIYLCISNTENPSECSK